MPQLYMEAVQRAAESAVRETLKCLCREKGRHVFQAEDYMDDGTRIKLKITIDPETGAADFDFRGTSPQAHGTLASGPFNIESSLMILQAIGTRR